MTRRTTNHDVTSEEPAGHCQHRSRSAVAVMLGILAAPVVYEVAASSTASWCTLTGPYTPCETPILDTIAGCGRECWLFAGGFARAWLYDLPWKAEILMAFGALWVALGWWLLRRS